MAKLKIITYDLCAPGKNYDDLIKYLKSYPALAKITESCWLVSTQKPCIDIRDDIIKLTDTNDKIFIAELNGTAAWQNAICDAGNPDCLKKLLNS